jgi:colicin import membrane protein
MDRIAVLLINQSPKPSARQAAPAKKTIPQKKSTISKKKRILIAKEPALKKSPIKKSKPAVRSKKPDLSKIRRKLAKEEQEKTVEQIKARLAQNKTANPPAAISAAGNYQLNRYAEQLKAWITDRWKLPELLLKEKLSATVSLTIDAAGNLVKQHPEKMSGNQLFDDSILKAIARAVPFPPFPPAMDKPQEEFVITFDPNDIQ